MPYLQFSFNGEIIIDEKQKNREPVKELFGAIYETKTSKAKKEYKVLSRVHFVKKSAVIGSLSYLLGAREKVVDLDQEIKNKLEGIYENLLFEKGKNLSFDDENIKFLRKPSWMTTSEAKNCLNKSTTPSLSEENCEKAVKELLPIYNSVMNKKVESVVCLKEELFSEENELDCSLEWPKNLNQDENLYEVFKLLKKENVDKKTGEIKKKSYFKHKNVYVFLNEFFKKLFNGELDSEKMSKKIKKCYLVGPDPWVKRENSSPSMGGKGFSIKISFNAYLMNPSDELVKLITANSMMSSYPEGWVSVKFVEENPMIPFDNKIDECYIDINRRKV